MQNALINIEAQCGTCAWLDPDDKCMKYGDKPGAEGLCSDWWSTVMVQDSKGNQHQARVVLEVGGTEDWRMVVRGGRSTLE